MAETREQVLCSQCGCDLTTTIYCRDYRIAVLNEEFRAEGEAKTLGIMPKIQSDHRFCDWLCLKLWVNDAERDWSR